MLKNIVRALRLPFITASMLPFVFGSLAAGGRFNALRFLLGLVAAGCVHLSANLINDYADSKSGNDWQDLRFWGLFGGSKLIQEKVFSEIFYLRLAFFFAILSAVSVAALAFVLDNSAVIGFYLLIILLGWSYSVKPLKLAYRRCGEIVIFILFGPALVMGGYFIQTLIFPDLRSFILSLPFGFFTTAILFSNEIPDFAADKNSGKMTWVSLFGPQRSYQFYYLLEALGFGSIIWAVYRGYLGKFALFSLVLVFAAIKAAGIIKKQYADKEKLVVSSRITIIIQAAVSVILIIDVLTQNLH